jgi:hypothetical protein
VGQASPARVRAVVRALIESVPVDDATFVRLANWDEILGAAPTVGEEPESAAARLRRWFAASARNVATGSTGLRPSTAIAKGGRSSSGQDTVEWGRVPPRTLSSAEDNVSWAFQRESGTSHGDFTVAVDIHPASRELSDSFFAAVFLADSLLPDAVVELDEVSEADARRLAGSALVAGRAFEAAAGRVRVRVGSERYVAATPSGASVAATPADRDRVVGIVQALIVGRPEFADQAMLPAYEVDPAAPWFPSYVAED